MFKLILKLGHSTSIVSLSGSKDHNFIRLEGPLFYPARRTIIVGLGLKLKLIFVGLDLNTCLINSWTMTEESPRSGLAVLEVGIPTGYMIQQQRLDSYVLSRSVRTLQRAKYQPDKLLFYFDYVSVLAFPAQEM